MTPGTACIGPKKIFNLDGYNAENYICSSIIDTRVTTFFKDQYYITDIYTNPKLYGPYTFTSGNIDFIAERSGYGMFSNDEAIYVLTDVWVVIKKPIGCPTIDKLWIEIDGLRKMIKKLELKLAATNAST